MFNLAVDRDHVTLAFGLKWIEALARHFDHIDVVTMTIGVYELPKNVTVWSLGKERNFPEFLRALRFYGIIAKILKKRRIGIVFTHMIPVFAVLFWPVAKLTRLRNVMWYAHKSVTPVLQIAHHAVDRVVTSTPEGFRLPSSKISYIGQGIDSSIFVFRERSEASVLRLITVGRIAPSKGLELLVDALAKWTATSWHLTIVGDGADDNERRFAHDIRERAGSVLGPSRVTFTGRLDPPEVAGRLADSDVFLNLSTNGSLDKAIVEAMASGCPVLSSNDAFCALAKAEGIPGAILRPDVASVHEALSRMASASPDERRRIAEMQSSLASSNHALPGLIKRLTEVLIAESRRAGVVG